MDKINSEKTASDIAERLKGVKAAIFDLDGTLFDSLWVWAEIDKRFLSKRGFEVPSRYSKEISAMSFLDTAKFTIRMFGLKETPEQLMTEWSDMARDVYAHEIRLKKGGRAFLDWLIARGVKLAIATSSTSDLYVPALKNNGIYELFSVICDTSALPDKTKPDIFLAAASKLGVTPSECAVFEDVQLSLQSVKTAGFLTVAVRDIHTGDETADLVIDDFNELLEILK